MAYGKLGMKRAIARLCCKYIVTFLREKVTTTEAKADAAEKMITLGKRGDLHAGDRPLPLLPIKVVKSF